MSLISVACAKKGLIIDAETSAFIYAIPKVVATKVHPLRGAVRGVFSFLLKNARRLPEDLEIPTDRSIGLPVEVTI